MMFSNSLVSVSVLRKTNFYSFPLIVFNTQKSYQTAFGTGNNTTSKKAEKWQVVLGNSFLGSNE